MWINVTRGPDDRLVSDVAPRANDRVVANFCSGFDHRQRLNGNTVAELNYAWNKGQPANYNYPWGNTPNPAGWNDSWNNLAEAQAFVHHLHRDGERAGTLERAGLAALARHAPTVSSRRAPRSSTLACPSRNCESLRRQAGHQVPRWNSMIRGTVPIDRVETGVGIPGRSKSGDLQRRVAH